jgi:hypothetical protein
MSNHDVPDHRDADAFDAMLLGAAPRELADDGFTARTMQAVARTSTSATRSRDAMAASALLTPATPIAVARALAHEQRRFAAQARLWRWALGGIIVGMSLLAVAIAWAPSGIVMAAAPSGADIPGVPPWFPLWTLLGAGAIWYAWQEFRSA